MWKNKQEEPKIRDISKEESYLQTVMRRFRKHHLAAVSLVILMILGSGRALLAPVIAPYDPDAIVGSFSGAPNAQFWLGTDQIGRDVLSRLSVLCGFLTGRISRNTDFHGNRRGAGELIARIFPGGGGHDHHAFYGYGDVLSLHPGAAGGIDFQAQPVGNILPDTGFLWTGRVSPAWSGKRAEPPGNQFYQREYRGRNAAGISCFQKSRPATAAPILVYATSVLALSMLDEAALSFLGLGVQPPRPVWETCRTWRPVADGAHQTAVALRSRVCLLWFWWLPHAHWGCPSDALIPTAGTEYHTKGGTDMLEEKLVEAFCWFHQHPELSYGI